MKILLTGCNGQVGWELNRSLLPLAELIYADRSQADLADLDGLRAFIQKHKPDVIVNPAAYTAVDKAETESGTAFLINAQAPGVLAEQAKKQGALLVHFSTDYVFDGTKTSPYIEGDSTSPLNVYGQSKLAGEQAIQATGADHLILRTSWVYAARGQNFLKTVLRLVKERDEISIVADQIGSPTWARLIAETTSHVLRQSMLEKQQGGFNSSVYNLTSSGAASWYEFAKTIVELAHPRVKSDIKNRVIKPIPATAYPLPAKRPSNSRLSCERLEQRFGLQMPSWESCLKLCLEELLGAD